MEPPSRRNTVHLSRGQGQREDKPQSGWFGTIYDRFQVMCSLCQAGISIDIAPRPTQFRSAFRIGWRRKPCRYGGKRSSVSRRCPSRIPRQRHHYHQTGAQHRRDRSVDDRVQRSRLDVGKPGTVAAQHLCDLRWPEDGFASFAEPSKGARKASKGCAISTKCRP